MSTPALIQEMVGKGKPAPTQGRTTVEFSRTKLSGGATMNVGTDAAHNNTGDSGVRYGEGRMSDKQIQHNSCFEYGRLLVPKLQNVIGRE